MFNITNRPSIIWDLLTKNKNKMDQYKVTDEEFFNLVTSYKLQDGTVTLAQLKEAALNTRAPEVVLNNFGLYDEVYGGSEVEVSNEATFKALIGAYKENDGIVTIDQLRDAAKNVIDPEYFLNEAGLNYKEILGNSKPKTLSQMNKTELTQKATELNITLTGKETNKQITELIIAATP